MSEQSNTETVKEIYGAFGRGDVPAVLAKLSEDVDWRHPRPADIPWGGDRRGRDAVAKFFAAIGQNLHVEQFHPEEFVERDDQVIVFGRERMRTTRTDRVYDVDWVHTWRLRYGQVAQFREYTDTATIVEALGDR